MFSTLHCGYDTCIQTLRGILMSGRFALQRMLPTYVATVHGKMGIQILFCIIWEMQWPYPSRVEAWTRVHSYFCRKRVWRESKDMGVERSFPMKRMTRKIQASVKNHMKSARRRFRIQDLCYLECQCYNHSNLQPRERSSVTVMQV